MNASGKHSWLKHLDFIVIDLVSLAIAFAGAYCLRFGNFAFITSSEWQGLLAILLLLNLVITLLTNPYSGVFRRPYYEDAFKMFLLALYSFICACVFFYIFKMGESYSRLMLAGMYIIYFLFSFAWKSLHKKRLLSGKSAKQARELRNMIVVTTLQDVEQTIEYVYSSDYKSYKVVGLCFVDGGERVVDYKGIPVANRSTLVEYATKNNIDDVFVAIDPKCLDEATYEAFVVNEIAVHISVENAIGIQTDVQSIERIGVYKTLTVGKHKFDSRQLFYFVVKRVFDIVLGLLGCILLLPVMLVTKLSYLKSGDNAPIIYKQTRVGLRGRPFKLYKLRSMVPNADEVLEELLKEEKYRAEWEEWQKLTDDPRITKMGKFLRKTSLDEFPQFINVLKGEMSIVGPRPLVEGELEAHDGLSLYNKVKPGITGWWGCNGRSNINYRERLELEYHYVKHCSLYLDALCIFRTAFAVLKRDGAQ